MIGRIHLDFSSVLRIKRNIQKTCSFQVFHGADMDIQWLQRDIGVYVVNMFDTSQASRVLNLSRFSLAHLLQVYCGIQADKQYQLADWRIRSVPGTIMCTICR